jgi:hypothetical protein
MRAICKHTVASCALVLASMHAGLAQAAQFLYTVTGVTTADVYGGLYGSADPTLPAGLSFTATFIVDDALPTAIYTESTAAAPQSSATGGGLVQDGTRPPVSASVQIGSWSYTVRTGTFYQPYSYDPYVGDAFGTEIREQDGGTVSKNAATGGLTLWASYVRTETCCGTFTALITQYVDILELPLLSASFASSDFRETGEFDLLPSSAGQLLVGSVFQTRSYTGESYEAAAGLLATHLVVTAIPEPNGRMLLLCGAALFAAASLCRRSRG